MKALLVPLLAIAITSAAVPVSLQAQAGGPSVPSADETNLRSVPPSNPAQPAPPTFELPARWNERGSGLLTVPLANSSERPLKVLGVQATRGIFIGDFPATIAPGKEDSIAFVYEAADNTEGDTDLIRVLTDQGIKEILVKVTREDVVRFDTRRVTWSVGDTLSEKNISITVPGRETMPKAVRTTKGNSATIEFPATGQYVIRIKPASTAEPHIFPVFVDFDPALPGGSVVLTCVVEKK